jgi:hypothetical protein
MKTIDRIRYLFEQYDQQVATPSETEELLQLVRDPAYDETIQDLFIKGVEDEKERELIRAEWDPVIQSILASLPDEEELVVRRNWRVCPVLLNGLRMMCSPGRTDPR